MVAEQESTEEHPTEVCPPASTGTSATRCSTQHPQTRGGTVQQGAATWLQGTTALRHKWWSEENPGNQDRHRNRAGWICQHNQQLLSWGNCQVSMVKSSRKMGESYESYFSYFKKNCCMTHMRKWVYTVSKNILRYAFSEHSLQDRCNFWALFIHDTFSDHDFILRLQQCQILLLPSGVSRIIILSILVPVYIFCVLPCQWLLGLLLSKVDTRSLMCARILVCVVHTKERHTLDKFT